jgi:hypothetical protein
MEFISRSRNLCNDTSKFQTPKLNKKIVKLEKKKEKKRKKKRHCIHNFAVGCFWRSSYPSSYTPLLFTGGRGMRTLFFRG